MYKNILVPLALTHGVSEQILAAAQRLCDEGGTITALHVYEIPPGTVSTLLGEEKIKEGRDLVNEHLTEKVKHIAGAKTALVQGHAYRSILDFAAKGNFDCIVIGSHKPGVSDYLIGSTAARVVRHAPCSVFVHRGS